VAYGQLLPPRRRLLHADVAHALEELSAAGMDVPPSTIGVHAFKGEQWENAFTYLSRAGDEAAVRWAHREAATCFEQALDAFAHLPPNHALTREAIDV